LHFTIHSLIVRLRELSTLIPLPEGEN